LGSNFAGSRIALSAAVLVVLTLVSGCATRPIGSRVLNAWTQLGPAGTIALRAIVPADGDCPLAAIDDALVPMAPRARATPPDGPMLEVADNKAFAPRFAVTSCELAVPPTARNLRIDGRALPLPKTANRRIVVVGDTGCRIKVPAIGSGDPIQDCANPSAWPWPGIAAAAARAKPDLVIHVGDYHYREYCDDPATCRPVVEKGFVIGYGWPGWNADFFTPANPLLAAAPWIFVRGNHENCDRAGEGWMRFLSPLAYRPCGNQKYKTVSRSVFGNNMSADAYRVDLDGALSLLIADNAGQEDYRPVGATPGDVKLFEQTLAILDVIPATKRLWFVSHRPIWYDLLAAASQPNALQTVLRKGWSDKLQLAFGGHQHAFETINFAVGADAVDHPTGRPAQVIVGGGGTQLEALDPDSSLYEGNTGVGGKERARPDGRLYDGVAAASGLLLNRYSFLLLERDGDGWNGTVLGPNGLPITRCRLEGGNKEFDCHFPGR
jgi:hypothetical protein